MPILITVIARGIKTSKETLKHCLFCVYLIEIIPLQNLYYLTLRILPKKQFVQR